MSHAAMHFVHKVWQGIKLFCAVVPQHIRHEWFGQYFPAKLVLMQLLIDGISGTCSNTVGSNREWGQDRRIPAEDLRKILADPLFSGIQHIDINVGEPTLRSDLSEIGQILISSLPKLKTMRLITSASHPQVIVDQTTALAQIAQAAGIGLDVSVSLDVIGANHGRDWRVDGIFVSAAEVIKALQHSGLSVSVDCALTPQNCYWADDVLLWCEENGIQECSFRLGMDPKAFYDDGAGQQRQFTPEQRFHLIMFFDKLARHPRVDLTRRLFYKSLVDQLAFGLPRKAKCYWQTRGVTLGMRGNIGYCPVQSLVLDSALEKSAWQTFREGMRERQRIVREHCSSCQYELLGPIPPGQIVRRGMHIIKNQYQQRRQRVPVKSILAKSILPATHNSPSEWQHVLITGWYGTETAGDKAILAEVLHFIKTHAPGCKVTLTTIDRKVSQQTQIELPELQGASLVDMARGDDPALIESVDAVIIGGGPLMEIRQMEYIWRMFAEANRQRKARIVFGCGVGPLYTDRMHKITSDIFRMTTAGFLRDQESYEYAVKHALTRSLGYACDPALAYLRRWRSKCNGIDLHEGEPLHITCLLRANTNEFITDQTKAELAASNAWFAQRIARILENVCRNSGARADLLHMNAHWLGGDDRIFNRMVESAFNDPEYVRVERGYLPLDALLQFLSLADAAIAMRYHGHLFCMAFGIPFLSIDYTGGVGKVRRLIRRIGYEQWSVDWQSNDVDHATERLQDLLKERAYWSFYLQQEADRLVKELCRTYVRVFGVAEKDYFYDN